MQSDDLKLLETRGTCYIPVLFLELLHVALSNLIKMSIVNHSVFSSILQRTIVNGRNCNNVVILCGMAGRPYHVILRQCPKVDLGFTLVILLSVLVDWQRAGRLIWKNMCKAFYSTNIDDK